MRRVYFGLTGLPPTPEEVSSGIASQIFGVVQNPVQGGRNVVTHLFQGRNAPMSRVRAATQLDQLCHIGRVVFLGRLILLLLLLLLLLFPIPDPPAPPCAC